MKFLFCGLGSVGQRHAKNLKQILPDAEIIAFRSTSKNISSIEKELKIKTYKSLSLALGEKPMAAFITNPTSLHINTAISCAKKGVHLFIEKPLSNTFQNISLLHNVVKNNNLVVMIGFMMRYHPGIQRIKQLLETQAIGRIISAQFTNGEYLPAWHPKEDYRKGYSAREDLGGGIILTFSHEIDLASWFFGKADRVYCLTNKSYCLNTNVEDSADILLRFEKKINVSIHLDHIAQPPVRTFSIIGEKGRIFFDYYQNLIQWYNPVQKKLVNERFKFEKNIMFIQELKEFIKAIKTKKILHNNLKSAKENLIIALSLKKSAIKDSLIDL